MERNSYRFIVSTLWQQRLEVVDEGRTMPEELAIVKSRYSQATLVTLLGEV